MIAAATGHRPNKLGGYGPVVLNRLIGVAQDWLRPRTDVQHVISGMALGWDQAWAYAALSFGIAVHAYIPFSGQELMWPNAAQLDYRRLIKRCSYVKICSPGGYSAAKMQVRNVEMVDAADHIVALHDGTRGGTFNCLEYARARGRPIDNLWEQWIHANA